MADYIKRKDALKVINSRMWSSSADHTMHNSLVSLINILPSADVVEVVRCKDCRFFDSAGCAMEDVVVYPNDYCSYGERAEA